MVNRGEGERSVVNRLEVRFEPDVEVDLRAIALTHLGISAPDDPDSPVDLTPVIMAYSPVDQTLTLEFVPSLADGFYELRLASAGFVNCTTNPSGLVARTRFHAANSANFRGLALRAAFKATTMARPFSVRR